MKRISISVLIVALTISLCNAVMGQRPRKISDPPKPPETQAVVQEEQTEQKEQAQQKEQQEKQNESAKTANKENKQTQNAALAQGMTNVKVKYEGGVFGYRQKMDGWLWFDDFNERLIFKDKQQKEIFSIPYKAISAAFADTQSRRPTAATVIGSTVPYGLGLPAIFIRKKYRYLTLQYNDTDEDSEVNINVVGITSFKVGNKEILEDSLKALAAKAKLTPRGDIYVRRKPAKTSQENPAM